MAITFDQWVFWFGTAIAAGGGNYFGSYLKKKGENVPTKEDFADLLKQVTASTEATKAIEGRITDDFWNKQRLWEMKRDALIGFLSTTERLQALLIHHAVYQDTTENFRNTDADLIASRQKMITEWPEANEQLAARAVEILILCDRSTYLAASDLRREFIGAYQQLIDRVAYSTITANLREKSESIFEAVKMELGVLPSVKEDKENPSA